ncbi:MAG: hypothetical protein AB7L66_09885 [Gemmatimonadales bacterium]
MQWRSASTRRLAASMLVAMIAAACENKPEDFIGPKVAVVSIVSGNGQTGPVGSQLPLPLVVRVEDQRGAGLPGAEIRWVIVTGTGTTLTPIDTTDSDGYAETLVQLGPEVGEQKVSARLADISPVVFTLNAATAPATRLVADSGDAQTGPVGGALDRLLVVRVTDAFGNPKAGVPVNFTVAVGGGTVSAATVVSDAAGRSRTRWTLGTSAGTQSVTVTAGALPSASFTATATPDDPAQFILVSGGNQIASPGATLPDSVVVRLVDQFGNPVGGVSVDWTPGAGSGTVSPTTTSTNASGRTAARWTVGSTGGPMNLRVRAGSVTFNVPGGAFINFESVSGGGRSTCGVDQGGVLYCWGYNGDGQLGIGNAAEGSGPIFALPQAVPPIGNQTFAAISSGRYTNCAVTLSHVGYCWGDNNNGQVGNGGATRTVNSPASLSGGIPFIQVSAGRSHSCGVSLGGRAYCWGSNERGQLAANVAFDSTTSPGTTLVTLNSNSAPAELGSPFGSGAYFFGPWDWSAIAAGGVHTCAIRQGGNVYCWGLGREGQLGNGTNAVDQYLPQLVGGAGPANVVTAGYKHSCARSTSGTVRCWGDNTSGQLGNGSTTSSSVPVTVGSFATVSAGFAHTCALTAAGEAFCWGANASGQLGNGSTTGSSAPVAVAGGLTFRSIYTGDDHTCGVTTGGVAYCWGDNEYGQLGDGTQLNRASPVKVKLQQ